MCDGVAASPVSPGFITSRRRDSPRSRMGRNTAPFRCRLRKGSLNGHPIWSQEIAWNSQVHHKRSDSAREYKAGEASAGRSGDRRMGLWGKHKKYQRKVGKVGEIF